MRYRQIHLDFHTSERIPGIGSRFDARDFARTLADASVDSVTVFSKCHHGWSYHPTTVGKQHPHLVKIVPTIWNNADNMAELKKAYDPKLDPFYSVAVEVKPWTHYTMDQILACKGP